MPDIAALDIVIGSKVEGAVSGLNIVQVELSETATAAGKTNQSFNALSQTVAKFGGGVKTFPNLGDKLKDIPAQAKKVEDGIKGLGKSSTNLTGLTRVIQDLPFGFIAISNNLEQLLPAAGGLGLAFSAVVAAISFAQVGLSNWTRGAGEAAKKQKEFTDRLKEFEDKASEGARSTGVQLQSFVKIARDSTKSIAERNEALTEANKILGEHGEKLTLVNINTKAVTDEVNKFTEALINQAIAAKFSDKIADLTLKQSDASKTYAKALKEYTVAAKDADEANKLVVSGGTGGTGGLGNVNAINKARVAFKALEQATTDYKDVTFELTGTTAEFNSVQEKAIKNFAAVGTKTKETKTEAEKIDEVFKNLTETLGAFRREQEGIGGDFRAQMINAINQGISALIKLGVAADDPRLQSLLHTVRQIGQAFNNMAKGTVDIVPTLDLKIKPIPPNKVAKQLVPIIPEIPVKLVPKAVLKGISLAEQFNAEFEKITGELSGGLASAISEGIGNAVTGKGDIFSPLFEMLGGMLIQLGKTLIGLAIGLEAIQKALKTLNPFVALAAGIGLVALGAIIQNSVKGMAMAEGGIVTGPTRALIGERGTEVVMPLNRLREFIQPANQQAIVLETRIRGNDLYLLQSRTNQRRNRTY
jgi:hypothetical protein